MRRFYFILGIVIVGVVLIVLMARLISAVSQQTQPSALPTASPPPREQTQIALTVLALNVQHTLTAQAFQGALTPILQPTTALPPPSTRIPTETIVITQTYTPTAMPTPTPIPAMQPSPALAPPVSTAAPAARLTLQPGLYLALERAEIRERAGQFQPAQGQFLVLLGEIINETPDDQCLYSRQLRLGYEGERFAPYVEGMFAAKEDYNRDYPGPINGHCLGPSARAATFILFDVPKNTSAFGFYYRDVRVGGLELSPRVDGSFDVVLHD